MPKTVKTYLHTPVAQGTRNNELYRNACQMRDAGWSFEETLPVLEGKGVSDGLSSQEARDTIESAFKGAPREAPQKPLRVSRQEPAPVSQPAPVPLPAPIPEGLTKLLQIAFWPDEHVSLGPGQFAGGRVQCPPGTTFLVEKLLERLAKEPIDQIYPFALHPDGLYIRINPVVKGGMADKDVTSYRHLLLEWDRGKSKQEQYSALLDSKLPLSAVIDSGNVSLHAWVRLEAADAKDFKRRAELVYQFMAKYGVDPQNKNPSRYSRCPGILRNLRK
jgi:hypothetical protein